MDKNKYPGYDANDTRFDAIQRAHGQMTNREFFTSNGKGGFYEGMEWNGAEWVPDAESRKMEYKRELANRCGECGGQKPYCECW